MKNIDKNITDFQFSLFIPENSSDSQVNLVCILKGDVKKISYEDFIEFCAIRDGVIEFLKIEYDGVYLTGDAFTYPYDEKNNSSVIEYQLTVRNVLLYEIIEKQNNKLTFINKKGLETIMTKQAPYKLWTLEALKNECKQRQFDPATYKDIKDKSILVKLLESVDAETKAPAEPVAKAPAKKAEAPKAPVKKPAPKPKPVEEVEEVPEETNDIEDLDEPEVEVETEVKKPVPAKKVVPPTPGKKAPVAQPKAPVATKKIETGTEAPVKKSNKEALKSVVELNEKLRKANLWISGCQFLSSDKKQALLDAKTDKDRKAIYGELEKKRAEINLALSEKMKGKALAKKAEAIAEEVPEVVEEVEEVVKPTPAKKVVPAVQPKAPAVPVKKAPVVPAVPAKKVVPPVPTKKVVPPVPNKKK